MIKGRLATGFILPKPGKSKMLTIQFSYGRWVIWETLTLILSKSNVNPVLSLQRKCGVFWSSLLTDPPPAPRWSTLFVAMGKCHSVITLFNWLYLAQWSNYKFSPHWSDTQPPNRSDCQMSQHISQISKKTAAGGSDLRTLFLRSSIGYHCFLFVLRVIARKCMFRIFLLALQKCLSRLFLTRSQSVYVPNVWTVVRRLGFALNSPT